MEPIGIAAPMARRYVSGRVGPNSRSAGEVYRIHFAGGERGPESFHQTSIWRSGL